MKAVSLIETSKNIVLIGMPGAGKSTVGVLLAKALGKSFEDTDLLIQRQTGKKLQELIDCNGVAAFLKIEESVVENLNLQATVIATGGSVVYSDSAMQHLRKNAVIVYIKTELQELQHRITNMSTRGIAIGVDQTLEQLYQERSELYERYADITVNSDSDSVEICLEKILHQLNS